MLFFCYYIYTSICTKKLNIIYDYEKEGIFQKAFQIFIIKASSTYLAGGKFMLNKSKFLATNYKNVLLIENVNALL